MTEPRCECDYDCEGDPLRYVKTSRYCPVHDMCESCMEVLGVIKDPSPLPTDKRPYWLCLACSKLCNECGDDPCKCEAPEPVDGPAEDPTADYDLEEKYREDE